MSDLTSLISRLPHRTPFVFVSEVISADKECVEAVWNIAGTEDFFRGHFPGDPIVPGVFLIEALAQTAGLSMIVISGGRQQSGHVSGMLVQSDVRFRRAVRPPVHVSLHAIESGSFGGLHRFTVRATVGGEVAAEGTLVLAVSQSGDFAH